MSSVIQILPDLGNIMLRSIFSDDSYISLIQKVVVIFLSLLIDMNSLNYNLDTLFQV